MAKSIVSSAPTAQEEAEMRQFIRTNGEKEATNKETFHLLCNCGLSEYPALCAKGPLRFASIGRQVIRKLRQEQASAEREAAELSGHRPSLAA